MAETFTIRVGDRSPMIGYKFGVDLTSALGATFSLRDQTTDTVFIDDQPAIIANGTYTVNDEVVAYTPADGVVFYPWATLDTATARKSCMGLFHVQWPGGLQETRPSQGFVPVIIGENF